MRMKSRLIIVGGFLGAGKTTLLWNAARKLEENGMSVGLITNDQASELVDTAYLERSNGNVEEVSGSCFCCNFNGFTDAVIKLSKDTGCEVIIAEPVGSCTDLSATILQPLKDKFQEEVVIAPLSVLVDPDRLTGILRGGTSGLHESAAYILRKQLEEADIILISKCDLTGRETIDDLIRETSEKWPKAEVYGISSKTGEGLANWMDQVLTRSNAGAHIAEVDYDTYAEGEAVLGWYNGSYDLSGGSDWNGYLNNLMKRLSNRFEKENAAIGHVKILIQNSDSHAVANLTGSGREVSIRGALQGSENAKLTINARVQMEPEKLELCIEEEMCEAGRSGIRYKKTAAKCLSPGRPNPTYRYDRII